MLKDPESKWLNCEWTPKPTLLTTLRAALPCEVKTWLERTGWEGGTITETVVGVMMIMSYVLSKCTRYVKELTCFSTCELLLVVHY